MQMEQMEFFFKPQKIQELQNTEKKLKGKMFEIITNSFKLHDKNGDNVLSKEEAKVFFRDFINEWKPYQTQLAIDMMSKAQAMQVNSMKQMQMGMGMMGMGGGGDFEKQ